MVEKKKRKIGNMCPILTGSSGQYRACVLLNCELYNADVERCGYGAFNIPAISK